jgi:hypothetical protein
MDGITRNEASRRPLGRHRAAESRSGAIGGRSSGDAPSATGGKLGGELPSRALEWWRDTSMPGTDRRRVGGELDPRFWPARGAQACIKAGWHRTP